MGGKVPRLPDVHIASRELKKFAASEAGQELIQTMFEVLGDVQVLARNCRGRHRIHGFFKAAAGVAALTGGVIVIVAATVMSGGTALPAEIAAATAFFAGGSITIASAAGVQIANTLTSLGFDKAQADEACRRMLALTELIQPWDIKFNDLLQAGGNLGSLSESISAVCNGISGNDGGGEDEKAKTALTLGTSAKGVYGAVQTGVAAKDAILIQNVMRSFLDMGLDGYVAGGAGYGVAAPRAMFGLAKAGSAGARGLFFGLSGVGIAFSLVDIVAGLSSMFSGQSEAADCLDAHADKLCMLLQIILIAGRGTPEADRILDQGLPQLLLVSIRSCTVRRPSYRFGDLTKKAVRKLSGSEPPEHEVYFSVAVRNRNRKTEVLPMSEQGEAVDLGSPQVVIMRVQDGDERLSLQMCARRGFGHRLTAGDSSLSKRIDLELPEASDHPSVHLCDREGLAFEYQVLNPPTALR